ncbi:gastrula zinc finger protein XlCGF26.1-like [Wyeomyia smithii]|uniref:gastrula zinc finger protein XlCGF26.1-like n=1 Tax=Wyeomyia smithii TaxID=174621 RepID=UPI002467DF1D|nr:gastrula zinc finger protein XlCGF26.1-like [Wyeomyia smithii]
MNTDGRVCRICAKPQKVASKMWSLFEKLNEKCPAATIIYDCFKITIRRYKTMNRICTLCKSDLKAAHRFVENLRISELQLKNASTNEKTIGVAEDQQTSAFVAELKIKTELLEENIDNEYEDEDNPTNYDFDTIHRSRQDQPAERPKKELPKKLNLVKEIQTKSTKLKEQYASPNWSSEEDNNSPEENEADPAPKRLYYGVKSNSAPKRCCSCKEPLDSYEKVREHSVTYHQSDRLSNPKEYGNRIFECSVCFKRFETKKLYLQHQRKMFVDVLHPCSRCEEEFANLFVLKKHIKVDHQKKFITTELEEIRKRENICCACKEKFITQDELREHVEKVHYPDRIFNETTNTFECNVCYNRFKTQKSLRHHQLRLFKEKKFVCTLCGKVFREKVRLAEHENLHRKITKFECPFCAAKFAIKNSFDVHVKMHDAEECFKCEYCGKGFRKKSLLLSHLQIHNSDRPFKCHLCPITFTRQNLLDSHILAHSGSKPHKCQLCSASYIHQRDLRRHIREKHEGIRSFKCHICPKAYIRQKLLIEHLKSHEN